MRKTKWNSLIAVGAVLLLATTGAALAQERSGNVFVSVTDTSGAPLPGVTVELTGAGAPQIAVSNAQGEVRFLKLDPGRLQIKASLEGFSTVEYPNVTVNIGRNTSIEVQLSAAIEEVITVTSESPLLDERRLASGTTISQIELEKIPTARDPWSILSQAAGVNVDRINVAGGEGGSQAVFRGNGVNDQENDFLVDGVQITDMAAVGASPTYYQFDQFEEMQLSTGGNDVTKNTSGVSVNLVTKRGTNEFRGSARFLLTRGDGYFGALSESTTGFDTSDLAPGQDDFIANSINNIQDFGFEAGGPVWRDRVWLWASWGQTDINISAGGGQNDRTVLEGTAVKLNAQFSSSNSFVGSFNNGDKLKFGRGANPAWDSSATWNQRGPTGISKFEDTHVFGSNFFLSGQYSFVDGGFSLTTLDCSGPDCPLNPGAGGEANIDANSFLTNNASGGNSRPTEELKLDGSYFFNTGGLSHELKFGGRTREASTESAWSYPGRNIYHYDGTAFGITPDTLAALGLPVSRLDDANAVYAYRQGPVPTISNYNSAWVQDTMTMGQWTFNVGFRYDNQDGENKAGTVDANIGFPEVMPALSFGGNNADGIGWRSISPRLGVTYALGEERRTLIRASLSSFPDALSLSDISRTSPVSGQNAIMIFLDSPGGFSHFYDDGETFVVQSGTGGFDPNNPTALSTSNVNDPDMDPPVTNEFIVGVEHSFLPEFVAGLNVTWRQNKDVADYQLLFDDSAGNRRTAGADEYLQDPVPITGLNVDGSSYSVDTFFANPGLTYAGGTFFTNGDRNIDYLGGALTFTKRLTNQWMLRGFVNYNFTEEWDVPSSFFNQNDPNNLQPRCTGTCVGGRTDGQTYVVEATGSGKNDLWMQSTWQWNLNGMYQVAPDRHWGFNVAANLSGREGYPIPYYRARSGADGIGRRILTQAPDDSRHDNVAVMDLRLEKEWRATGNTSLTFSIDGFNIFNEGTVLQRLDNVAGDGPGGATGGFVSEVLSPRVWRLGVRLNWR